MLSGSPALAGLCGVRRPSSAASVMVRRIPAADKRRLSSAVFPAGAAEPKTRAFVCRSPLQGRQDRAFLPRHKAPESSAGCPLLSFYRGFILHNGRKMQGFFLPFPRFSEGGDMGLDRRREAEGISGKNMLHFGWDSIV